MRKVSKIVRAKKLPRPQSRQSHSVQLGSVVDVFCGVGGLSHGFVKEGFKVVAGIDLDSACQYAFEKNNKSSFLNWDVQGLTGRMINDLFLPEGPRILIGCAPCQPFSSYAQRKENDQWRLLHEFGRIIREATPDIVSMENVARLSSFKGGKVFDEFQNTLTSLGYNVSWSIEDCTKYGVPQLRRRLVLLASKLGPIHLLTPKSKTIRTVRDAIGHLPKLKAGQQSKTDLLHIASGLSEQNLKRIRAAKPGGSWRDWNKSLVAECHKRETGKGYSSVYGRMTWDEPSPTITTQCFGFGNGRFGHPDQDRAISLREAAILQSFPENYQFIEPGRKVEISPLGRAIGNAVPVALGRSIAKSIAANIRGAS